MNELGRRRSRVAMVPVVAAFALLQSAAVRASEAPSGSTSVAPITPPAGWVVVPPPDEVRLRCANASRMEWNVWVLNGSVVIDEGRAQGGGLPPALWGASGVPMGKGSRHVLAVDGGYLVGGDAGEFGGGLAWFSRDGKASAVLHREPVQALIPLGPAAVLSLEGLNHLGMRTGTARWLTRADGAWSTTRTVKLEEGPWAVAAGPREAYVVGPEFLTVVSYDGSAKTIQRLPLGFLYPSSMAREEGGTLWVGARQFVLRLAPRGPGQPFDVTWLAPAGCRTATMRGFDCVCGN